MPITYRSSRPDDREAIRNHYTDMANVMRQAELARAQATARTFRSLWQEIGWLFRSRKAIDADQNRRNERPAAA